MSCTHDDTWDDGVRWFCSNCLENALIDPFYDYEDDDRD